MPIQPTYPGVYIEEIPSGVRTITGVATSVAAFIGYFRRGPVDHAVQIFNMGDFERIFGGLDVLSEASYAIQQFFLNGGTQAYVIRVAAGNLRHSNVVISNVSPAGGDVLTIRAIDEGTWGDNIRVKIDHDTDSANSFNMLVTEYDDANNVVRQEFFRNLFMDSNETRYVDAMINDANQGSKIIWIENSNTNNPPAASGTTSGAHADVNNITFTNDTASIHVLINGVAIANTATFSLPDSSYRLRDLALILENALRSVDPSNRILSGATVGVSGNYLHILAGGDDSGTIITFVDSGDLVANELELTTNAIANIQEYSLGLSGNSSFLFQSTPWATSTVYEVGDYIIESGDTYRCLVDHVSDDTAFANDPAANWTVIANEWVTGTNYVIGDFVTESNTIYRSLTIHTAAGFDDDLAADNWLAVPNWQLLIDQWDQATNYSTGDLVLEDSIVYRSLIDHTSAALFATDYDADIWVAIEGISSALVSAQISGIPGGNGEVPDGDALIGNENEKIGFYALEDVDLFNILCIPRTAMVTGDNAMSGPEASTVITRAIEYCRTKRAFFIMDTPLGRNDLPGISNWIADNATLRSENAALYYPRVRIADPLNNYRLRSFGASGTIAGLYARTDGNRGVWKAPAGTEANLRNVSELDDVLSDRENGVLNPIAVNCLRNFPVYGNVSWGGRTLAGADANASEWKYVPVRRLALFLEESLFRGSQWVVFEPNDEPLWAQIRLNVGAFMNNLFKQGAFQGTSPKEAYLVKCDKETTTQNDINQGIVNILVGFAPLKPAEFVFIKIQQLAGQIES